MKKVISALVIAAMTISFLTACGNGASDSHDSRDEQISGQSISTDEPGAADRQRDDCQRTPLVMVDGKLYSSTGYVTHMLKCGTPDGTIKTQVSQTQVPAQDDESNFCKDVDYQLDSDDCIILFLPEGHSVFRDVNADRSTMPSVVANFDAKVEEAVNPNEARVKVTYVPDTYGISQNFMDSELIVDLDTAEVPVEPKVGDNVRIWFSGTIEEALPARVGAYRLEVLEDS